MKLQTINRDHCILTEEKSLELLHTFKNFPTFMGCTDKPYESDTVSDLNIYISKNTGMLQINPLIPLEVLYPESHNSGLVGKSWDDHHESLAKFIMKYNPNTVLEIGGGHGLLSNKYKKINRDRKTKWTIVEPNPTVTESADVKVIKAFFDNNFILNEKVDAVVHSHLFEHMYDPVGFVKDMNKFLDEGKMTIFSVPNMHVMFEKLFTNFMNFEHTILLTEQFIDYMLQKNNFSIIEKLYYKQDHSIFYAARKSHTQKNHDLPNNYDKNKKNYLEYISFHKSLFKNVDKQIANEKEVFVFGAHAQSQFMFHFGLDAKKIYRVLDNDKQKQGRRLCGTNLLVASPEIIKNCIKPIVILRAGAFENEIKEQLYSLNKNVMIVTG